MSQNKELINRVANSGLITIELEEHLPTKKVIAFDLKDFLFQGLILREKDFRQALKAYDWSSKPGDVLAVYCSADAIIPQWAYMLVAALAAPHFDDIRQSTPDRILSDLMIESIDKAFDFETFTGQRVVVKGCSDQPVPASAYLEITRRLQPFAQSIMYGEPCSTVPIFKRPRELTKK